MPGGEEDAIHNLLDEALAAGTERCTEPTMLDPAMLQQSLAAQLGT